jgi:hypothetical protein
MFSKSNVKQIQKHSEVEVSSESSEMKDLPYTVAGNGQQQEMLQEVLP